VPIAALEKRS